MAKLILNRPSRFSSMFVALDVTINKVKQGKILNGETREIEVEPGVNEVHVSALYGIYRSKKLTVLVKEPDEEVSLEIGPNISAADEKNPLFIIISGLVFWRAYSVVSKDPSQINFNPYANKKYRKPPDILFVTIMIVPVVYGFLYKHTFPELYQMIGNSMIIFGLVFEKAVSKIKKVDVSKLRQGSSFYIVYLLLMFFITSENTFLFYYNMVSILFLLIYAFVRQNKSNAANGLQG